MTYLSTTSNVEAVLLRLESKSDSAFNDAVLLALDAKTKSDDGKWVIGDLAAKINSVYGNKTIQKFSRRVGIARATLYEYRQVAQAIDHYTRAKYAGTLVGWSHFRIAMRVAHKVSIADFLADCLANELTVEKATAKAKVIAGKKRPQNQTTAQYIKELETRIEALEHDNARLRMALTPFAAIADYEQAQALTADDRLHLMGKYEVLPSVYQMFELANIDIGIFRQAKEALNSEVTA